MASREPSKYFETTNYIEMIFNAFRMNYAEEFERIFDRAKSEALNSKNDYNLSDVKTRAHLKFDLNKLQSSYLELYDEYIVTDMTFDQRSEVILKQMLDILSSSNPFTERYPLFKCFKINLKEGILIDYLNSEINKMDSADQDSQIETSAISGSRDTNLGSFADWFTDETFAIQFIEQLKKFNYIKDSKWEGLQSYIPHDVEIPIILVTLKVNKKLSSIRKSNKINLELLLDSFNEAFKSNVPKNKIYDFNSRFKYKEFTDLDKECMNQLENFFEDIELKNLIIVNN